MADLCSSCAAPIRWCKFPSGKPHPLNAEPDPTGNIFVAADGTVVLGVTKEARATIGLGAGELYKSHFATCKFAAQHRSPK